MGVKKSKPAPRRAAKPARPRPGITIASLAARVAALEAEVAALRAQLPRPAAAPAINGAALATALLEAAAELDARQRLGGLVPIPELRRAMRARGGSGSENDAAITDALLALEREFRIDLSVAQSPTTVSDRALGIERPGRGLLYYVTRREPARK